VRDALDLILGGRSITAEAAFQIGVIDDLIGSHHTDGRDALSAAHAMVRTYVRDGAGSALGRAWAERQAAVSRWESVADVNLDAVLEDDFLQRILRQLDWAGRGQAGARALEAVRVGLEQGITAGTAREAKLFAEAIVDPEGGKTGIRQFMDKVAPPLPVRRDGVWIDAEHEIARTGA
jgi:acrylyl-CoA reductase (NADPH) / 3-hydroxypropionyl-CoA dehydratase / 3-hydroxypropionyl-CoA synthetase